MTTVADVLDALAEALPASLNRYGSPQGTLSYPAAVVLPPTIPDYSESLSGDDLRFEVEVLVLTSSSSMDGVLELRGYSEPRGDDSIAAAVNADRTLDLDGVHAWVRSSRPLGLQEVAAYQAFGSSFTVDVMMTP